MQTISKNPPSQKMRKRKKHAEEMGALEASRGAWPLCTGSDPGSMRAGRDAEGTARAEIDKLPVELRPLAVPSDDVALFAFFTCSALSTDAAGRIVR